jgi:hypothetical protein
MQTLVRRERSAVYEQEWVCGDTELWAKALSITQNHSACQTSAHIFGLTSLYTHRAPERLMYVKHHWRDYFSLQTALASLTCLDFRVKKLLSKVNCKSQNWKKSHSFSKEKILTICHSLYLLYTPSLLFLRLSCHLLSFLFLSWIFFHFFQLLPSLYYFIITTFSFNNF